MRTAMLVVALGLAACGTSEAETATELPGSYGEIIASETDCTALQDIFDTAEQSNMDGRVDVMDAADERMVELGC